MASSSVYYAWVATHGTVAGTPIAPSNTDPQIYISHEILETLCDPDANIAASGWISTTFCPSGNAACELSDKCEITTGVGNYGPSVGVNCMSTSYFSNAGGGCVIPSIVPANNPATKDFVFGGGKVLAKASIAMLFWGPAWTFTNSANPAPGTADEIKRGVQTLITNTAFYNLLNQYGVAKPVFNFAAINATTPPVTFRDSDIQKVIRDSITSGILPNPAANTDPILYVVIVAATAQFVDPTVIGSHGTFPFGTAPPTPIPVTNPPGSGTPGVPPPPPAVQADQFGITMLYPTKAGGSTWVLPATPNTDARHVVDATTFVTNADGSYKNTQSNVVYNISQNTAFNEASLVLNQATLTTQGYMQTATDWKNVEMTGYYRVNAISSSTHSGPASITHAMRGAIETNSSTVLNGFAKSCEAADYRMMIEIISGVTTLQKDLQYTAGLTPSSQNPHTVPPSTIPGGLLFWQGQWVGIKTVAYNRHDGTSVKLEYWIDVNNENRWTKVIEYIDQGNWTAGANACGGTKNMVINWGGPLCKFIWTNITDIDIKFASIREIDVFAQNSSVPSLPSNATPTVDPTQNPANNLAPIPPAANVQPPKSAVTGTLDKFGVKEIYPSITGGESWYLSANGLKGDSRVIGIPSKIREHVNGDGSFHLSNNDDVLFFVTTTAGYSFDGCGGLTGNHHTWRARQYMFAKRDWKNVEVTSFHQIEGTKPKGTLFDFGIKCRTGSHNQTRNCQGCCYAIHTRCDVGHEEHRHRKEQFHEQHADDRIAAFSFASPLKRWIGEKLVAYNLVDKKTGRVTGVRLEHYWCDSGDGVTWKKINSATDTGGWGFADGLCGGDPDEIIIWGGPLIAFFWSEFTNVNYKWLSIREIDVGGQSSPPGGPPTPSPPSGPPPVPPVITPLVGPNVYNVCKFISSVIIDDSGGCNIGVNPLAHIGETQLGIIVPGTNSFINMSSATGHAQRVGQKVVTGIAADVFWNKIIAEVVFNLRIVGIPIALPPNPPLQAVCTIRRGFDDTIVNTFGAISPNLLSSVFQPVSFKSPAIPNYTLAVGDIITLEFSGGDSNNYIQIQTDTVTARAQNGANSYAMQVVNGVVTNLTTTDLAGGFWSTGQVGVQATNFYNITGAGNPIVFPHAVFYISNGGPTKIAEHAVNASSLLGNRVVNEIDVWLVKRGTVTGNVLAYVFENIGTGQTYPLGTLDASLIPDVSVGPKQFNFINYRNLHANTTSGNTFIVIEYSGGDINNQVGVMLNYSNPYDADNSNAYSFAGSWTVVNIPSSPAPAPSPSPTPTPGGGTLTTSNASVNTAQNTLVDITLTAVDSNGGAIITYTNGSASNGTLAFQSASIIRYTPNNGYSGPDAFTFQAHDNFGLNSNTSTVSITVGAGGGGGFVSVFNEPYANNTRPMNSQQNTMVGEAANTGSSVLVGKKVTRADVYMYIFQGNPSGTVSCVILNSGGSTMATLGSISAGALSRSNGAQVTFSNTGSSYTMVAGDRVAITYSGGDFLNSIYVNYQTSGTQDGSNSCMVDTGGTWTSFDVCMKIWTGGP